MWRKEGGGEGVRVGVGVWVWKAELYLAAAAALMRTFVSVNLSVCRFVGDGYMLLQKTMGFFLG